VRQMLQAVKGKCTGGQGSPFFFIFIYFPPIFHPKKSKLKIENLYPHSVVSDKSNNDKV